jgi:cell division protein FtsL
VGIIFVAVAFVTILLISLYCSFFNKMRKQTRLEQRVARRERAFDRDNREDEDLEMQEAPFDDLRFPPKAMTRK